LDQLKLIQAAFAGQALPKGHPDALLILQSREYGASRAVLQLAKELELDRALYSRPEPWVKDVLAMIAGRLIYQGSKLFLSHQGPNTTLWEQCGVQGPVDVQTHCYEPMDRLLQRQVGIQKALARQHLQEGGLVLYDITSSYFEGQYQDSEIVAFGYNRDGKRKHEQMVIGLICNQDGCPVGVEVFAGNTQDASTVPAKIREIQQRYGIKKLIFVGDRGMVTQANYEKVKDWEGLWTISALTHQQILDLLERKLITPELFDERKVVEVIDPDHPKLRYCLCRNPETKAREGATRQRLLELTRSGLEKIARSKGKADAAHIGARVGKLLAKYKMGKFVSWEVKRRKLRWSVDQKQVQAEEIWDGCYVVRSDVPQAELAAAETVAGYKKLELVEQAFRQIKTVQLARLRGFDLGESFLAHQIHQIAGESCTRTLHSGCSADLPCSQDEVFVHNQPPSCFCAAARERRMAKNIVTGASSRTSGARGTGSFNVTFFIWVKSTTSSRPPGKKRSRFLSTASRSPARWRCFPRSGRWRCRTNTLCGSSFRNWPCVGPANGVPAGWLATSTTNWSWINFGPSVCRSVAKARGGTGSCKPSVLTG
jgi:hypothetical protein